MYAPLLELTAVVADCAMNLLRTNLAAHIQSDCSLVTLPFSRLCEIAEWISGLKRCVGQIGDEGQ